MSDGCRHCGQRKRNRPRGLCYVCYYAPGIRDLYKAWGKLRREYQGSAEPAPTKARPGSFEKVLVLEARAAMGLSLWSPLDYSP